MYESTSGSNIAHADLASSSSPIPESLTLFKAVPTNINLVQTVTFTLKVTLDGGMIERFTYILNIVCGLTTSGMILT